MWYEQFELLCTENSTTPTAFVTNVLKLSSSKVTAWKQGSIPKIEILRQIAAYFHVTVGYLFDGKEKSLSPKLSDDKQELIELFDQISPKEQGIIIGEMRQMLRDHAEAKKDETA